MTEIFFPLQPRPREDPAAAGVVQGNLEYVMQLFEKGVEDGDVLTWDAIQGRFTARPAGGVEVVTSLPTSPEPGQEIILTDSLTSPTFHWPLRYNAGSSSSYKWESTGPSPGYAQVDTLQATTSTTYTDLTTVGPDFTLPTGVGGDFIIAQGGRLQHDVASNDAMMSYALGATGAIDADAAITASPYLTSVMMQRRKTGISAGALIRCKYRSSTASFEARFSFRWLSVVPQRVG